MRPSAAIERFHRTRRRLGFDRNDLRRGIDRLQWRVGLALALLFVVTGTTVGFLAAKPVYDNGLRAERQERAARHQVVATVLGSAVLTGTQEGVIRHVTRVRWTERDGTSRTGTAETWASARPGETRRLWVDSAGRETAPPRSHGRTVFDTACTATGGAVAVGLLLLVAYMLVRQHCDRLRAVEWDVAWAGFHTRRIS